MRIPHPILLHVPLLPQILPDGQMIVQQRLEYDQMGRPLVPPTQIVLVAIVLVLVFFHHPPRGGGGEGEMFSNQARTTRLLPRCHGRRRGELWVDARRKPPLEVTEWIFVEEIRLVFVPLCVLTPVYAPICFFISETDPGETESAQENERT
jgi:hypothetical protein